MTARRSDSGHSRRIEATPSATHPRSPTPPASAADSTTALTLPPQPPSQQTQAEPDDRGTDTHAQTHNDSESSAVLFPAVVIGLLPALANFAWQQVEMVSRAFQLDLKRVVDMFKPMVMLQQGYILVAMLWCSAFCHLTVALEPLVARSYRRLPSDRFAALKACVIFALLALLSLFGVIHTVTVDANGAITPAFIGAVGWLPDSVRFFAAYGVCSILCGIGCVVAIKLKRV